jgi:hypothetical protein
MASFLRMLAPFFLGICEHNLTSIPMSLLGLMSPLSQGDVWDVVDPLQLQQNLTQLEFDLKNYLAEGETEFRVSSWISASGGNASCAALVKALDLPVQFNEGESEPSCSALPYLWVGKSYYILKNYGKSLKFHRKALKVQLQNVGQYEPLTAEILRSMASLHTDMGTPTSVDHARLLEDAALRIKWRIYGRDEACSRADILRCTITSPWESLRHEMTGDHLLLLSRDVEGMAMYQEAALMEYSDMGSKNMNLALIYRKIAISGLRGEACAPPVDSDPFGTLLPPTCHSPLWEIIRRGDGFLVEGRYEAAIRTYTTIILHQTDEDGLVPASNPAASQGALIGMASLVILHAAIYLAIILLIRLRQVSASTPVVAGKTIFLQCKKHVKDTVVILREVQKLFSGITPSPTSQPDTPVSCDDPPPTPNNSTVLDDKDMNGGPSDHEMAQWTTDANLCNVSIGTCHDDQLDHPGELIDSVHESFGRHSFESLGSIMERASLVAVTDLPPAGGSFFHRGHFADSSH